MMIDTPCIKVCFLDPEIGLCTGCGRTLHEIARWSEMTTQERRAIMAALRERMLAAGLIDPSTG